MPQSRCLASALKAADWFVNTQVLMQKPQWDANHGRFVYTYHIPTRFRVLGLSWTQGRGILTLLAAYEATGKPAYLKAAIQAGEYIKHLQIMDSRDPRIYGAIREEVPASWYVYTRDALEAGLGLIFLHRATRTQEWLDRARLFGDWFVDQAMAGADWAPAAFFLDKNEPKQWLNGHAFFLAGGATFLVYLSKSTGNAKYADRGFRPMMERLARDYIRDDGMILTKAKGSTEEAGAHHEAADPRYRGIALNDDCCGQALVMAYQELGQQKFLDLAVKYGKGMMAGPYPLPNHAALPLRALTLAEISRAARDNQFSAFAANVMAPILFERQVCGSGDSACEGAFRGEDENPEWYSPPGSNATEMEFVNTRMTAYAASAMFKLDGAVFGPYYSAFDWDRPVPAPAAGLLAPYRI